MLWNLEGGWLLMSVSAVAALSYMLALLLEGLKRDQGFGPLFNAGIITIGFFAAIAGANSYGIHFDKLEYALYAGLCGGLVLFLILNLLRALIVK